MRLLMLGMERALLNDKNTVENDAIVRFKEYGKHVKQIVAVIHSLKEKKLNQNLISKNVLAIPTNGDDKIDSFLQMFLKGADMIRLNGSQLIVTQDPLATGIVGYALKLYTGRPLFVNLYSSFFDNEDWRKEKWYNFILEEIGKFIVRRADGVRVECETEKRVLIANGVKEDKIMVGTIPFNLDKFLVLPMSKRRTNKIIYVGRLSKEKNVMLLLRAARLLKFDDSKLKFYIYGMGEEHGTLTEYIERNGLTNVKLCGAVPHDELPDIYRDCDMLVLPSNYEGIPAVVIEAMAAGKTVISTNTRDIDDLIINNLTGWIIPKNDVICLLRAIEIFYDVPQSDTLVIGKIGRDVIRSEFDKKKGMQKLLSAWKKAATVKK